MLGADMCHWLLDDGSVANALPPDGRRGGAELAIAIAIAIAIAFTSE